MLIEFSIFRISHSIPYPFFSRLWDFPILHLKGHWTSQIYTQLSSYRFMRKQIGLFLHFLHSAPPRSKLDHTSYLNVSKHLFSEERNYENMLSPSQSKSPQNFYANAIIAKEKRVKNSENFSTCPP